MFLPRLAVLSATVALATGVSWSPTLVKTYVTATEEAVTDGDGGGVDEYFRNSGLVLSADGDSYWAVNGVHPVISKDYTSYYPKSVIKASLSDDSIELRCPFYGSSSSSASEFAGSTVSHELDMEALTFGPDAGATYMYIGDEYNYIYQMQLADCTITKQWDLNDIVGDVSGDKGIEALTYSVDTGYFYAGIQDTSTIHVVSLADYDSCTDTTDCTVTEVDNWSSANAPSGMFYYAVQQVIYVFMGTTTNGAQYLNAYDVDGTVQCELTIPSSFGIARGDGFFIDDNNEYAYIVDSQGPMWDESLGGNLYKVVWDDPCGLGGTGAPTTTPAPTPAPAPTAESENNAATASAPLVATLVSFGLSLLLLRT